MNFKYLEKDQNRAYIALSTFAENQTLTNASSNILEFIFKVKAYSSSIDQPYEKYKKMKNNSHVDYESFMEMFRIDKKKRS
ncbi:CLUMA_CG017877, isoform A [Clunio marinus]|uniref:CLUMA_CG017877, isoform A n=1 Tax=Clunio marinus TaxID=568069 RepID=A0A1J1IXK5_9DIPT|nr:CLUMA_CG017877, isoform A [Clunio marinus]